MYFSVLKIKVSFSPLFFAVLTSVLILDKTGISGFAVLFSFLHELGHVLALLCRKIKPKAFFITVFGIHIRLPENLITTEKCFVLMAGFIVNYILAVIFFIFQKSVFGYINLLLGIFTSLPLASTDGGEILKTLLEEFFVQDGEKIFRIISWIFAVILSLLLLFISVFTKNFFILFAVFYMIFCTIKKTAK